MHLADKPQNVSELTRDGYKFFKLLFFKLLSIILLHALFFLAITIIYNVYPPSYTNIDILIVTLSLYLLLIAYLSAAIFIRADGILSNNTNKTADAWHLAKKVTLKLVGIKLLLLLVYFGMLVGVILLVMFLSAVNSTLGIVSFLLTLPIYLHVIVRLIFTIPLTASRQKNISSAISKSFQLSRGNVWKIVSTFFLVIVIPFLGFFMLDVIITLLIPDEFISYLLSLSINMAEILIFPVLFTASLLVLLNDAILRSNTR